MKRVAAFAFSSTLAIGDDENRLNEIGEVVQKWLHQKGMPSGVISTSATTFTSSPGVTCLLTKERIASSPGQFRRWILLESQPDTIFRTTLVASAAHGEIVLFVVLETGPARAIVVPIPVDVRCPFVVRDVLRLPYEWQLGSTRVQPRKLRANDAASAELLGDQIESQDRTLPIVAVSERDGFLLHPNLDEDISYDLSGLATVASLNEVASWSLTRRFGREWSCFNGAVRIYWPPTSAGLGNAFNHPLWTAERLLEVGHGDTKEAADVARKIMRNRIMSVASFAIPEPSIIHQITSAHRQEQLDRIKQDSSSQAVKLAEWEELATSYSDQLVKLEKELASRQEMIERLKVDLQNQQLMREYSTSRGSDEVLPENVEPPKTVAQAYEKARAEFSKDLHFGGDVELGIQKLDPAAGPPQKIYEQLATLADAAKHKRTNTLGRNLQAWLTERGVNCSGEDEITRKNEAARRRRTWKTASGTSVFDFHLKPNDGTSPDKCVRVYCEWDGTLKKYVIGYIGRHPD
jgi:hypothetical protein